MEPTDRREAPSMAGSAECGVAVHIGAGQGRSIFRALADVSPDVTATLHDATRGPK